MSELKCCGNCAKWTPYYAPAVKVTLLTGVCVDPIMMSLLKNEDDGTNCPCHEKKGGGDVSR
jgi:hypothetical protein